MSAKPFKRISRYVRPYKGLLVVTFVVVLAGTVFGLAAPWPIKILIDNVLPQTPAPVPHALQKVLGAKAGDKVFLLSLVSIAMVVIVVVENLLGVVNNYVTTKL